MENTQFDDLLKRMPKIAEVVNAFKSEAVQQRAFEVLISESNLAPKPPNSPSKPEDESPSLPQDHSEKNEIPGIALLEEDGSIRFTIRDIKAKNANDAGVRLTLVAAYVHEKLTGNPEVSRKAVLNPLLKDWRVYTGNIRGAIAKHKGIVGEDGADLIKLDSHAKEEAKQIIKEIENPEIKGKWKPNSTAKRSKKTKNASDN